MISAGCTCNIEGSPCPCCRNKLNYDPSRHIPRPEPATEWDVEWLPPVGGGVECEMQMTFTKWESVEVLAHKDGGVVLWHHAKRTPLFTENKEILRPIRTKAERDREELVDIVCGQGFLSKDGNVSWEIADAILAAGWQKPE